MDSGEVGVVEGKEECMAEGPPETPIGQEFWRVFGPQSGASRESSLL